MGKTKTAVIDDSQAQEEVKKPQISETKKQPKDALAASLLEELNQEFGEAKSKEVKVETKESKTENKKTEEKTETASEKPEAKKVTPKKGKEKPRSKKYKAVVELVDRTQKYPLKDAVELVQKVSYSKFDGTLEAHINTHLKNIRGLVNLPFASGKKLRILAFGKDAKDSGADIVGDEEKISLIEKGKIDFDVVVTTPEWMPKLAKVAKVLGPRGLMPNPKNGTISDELKKIVAELQAGKTEYKTEANNKVIHLGIGKITQPTDEIMANVKSLFYIIGKGKIRTITLAPTMGPGVKVDLSSI